MECRGLAEQDSRYTKVRCGYCGKTLQMLFDGRETLQPESTGVIIKVNLWLKIVNRQKNMSSRVFMEIQKIDTGLKPRFWYSIALESRTAHEARGARKHDRLVRPYLLRMRPTEE